MKLVIILTMLLIACAVVAVIYATISGNRADRRKVDRSEFNRLRELESEVTGFALHHMDADPTARALFYIIQENKGKEIK